MANTKTKRKQIEASEAKAVLDSVKNKKSSNIITEVNNLHITIQKTFADICATVTAKMKEVDEVDTAIELKNQRLAELFNIESEALSLEDLRAQRLQEQAEWECEREGRNQQWEDEDAEHAKRQNRDEENWQYEFEQKKKRAQEEFEAEVLRTKRSEQLRHEALERNWIERDSNLKSREQELVNLRSQVEGFDTRLAEAVKKAETSGFSSAASKYNHEIALLKKDAEAEKKVLEMKAVAAAAHASNLENQIEDLNKQLNAARQDAKEIASQALQSASNRQLADTLQRVVTETQSGTGTRSK